MKRYVIKVYEYQETIRDYKFVGYFTKICRINKGYFCGYDSYPDYEYVTKYARESYINKLKDKLDNYEWGGETFIPQYKFEVQKLELNKEQETDKEVISRRNRDIAKVIIQESISNILHNAKEYVKLNDINEKDAKQINEVIINKLSKII